MSRGIWIHRLNVKLSCRIGWRVAAILAFGLLSVAGMREPCGDASSQSTSAQAQDQNHLAARKKFVEGEALRAQGTAEYLRLALKKYEEALPLWRAAGDRSGEAATLYHIGEVYDALGEKQKALDFYYQALALCRAIGEREGEAGALNNIGVVYNSLGEKQKALDFFTQSLPLRRAVGNRRGEAITLYNIGDVYDVLGEKQKALDLYNQALPLLRAVGNRKGEVLALYNIGRVYHDLGEKRKALDFFTQALPLFRVAGNREGEAAVLNHIGQAYDALGQGQKALDFFTQALPLFRSAGDRSGEAAVLNNIGLAYNSLGEKQKALDFYHQALDLCRAASDCRIEATTVTNIGLVYDSLAERRKALDFFTQAMTIHRASGNLGGEIEMLLCIGQIYYLVGERQKALDFFTQALPLFRAAGHRHGEAITLYSIGNVYAALGERQKALEIFAQSLPLWRAAADRGGDAETLKNIGQIYDALGQGQKALDFFTQALPLFRSAGDRSGEAETLLGIAIVYDSLGERQKALDFFTQSLPLFRAAGDRRGEAAALYNIGLFYKKSLGEKGKARDFFTQSLSLFHAAGHREGEAEALLRIGDACDSLGEKRKALDFFTKSLPLWRAVGNFDGEATTLYKIAVINRALGHNDESRSHIESALKIIESIRARVVSRELRISYFATAQSHYQFYIDLLMQMHSREPAKVHTTAALEASERFRARVLLESLTEARADIRRGVDPKLLQQERSLQQRLNAKAEEALKLSAGGADEARLAPLRREMDALTIEIQQVQTQIRQTSPRYAALTLPQPLNLAEIQRQALDADTLLLEYSLGEERSFLWAVTPTTINSYELPKREEIEAAAKRVYKLLSNARGVRGQTVKPVNLKQQEAGGEYLAVAASLSRTLLGPVAGQLGKKRLLIVADGALHYIPFGALPDPNSPNGRGESWQPLLVEHEIVNLPSASTIAVLRRELAGRKPAARTLAVLADPVFSRDDERIKPGASAGAARAVLPDPLDESRASKLVQITGGAAGGAPGELRINRLPFTRLEAEAITALAPTGTGMKALDFEASRATATGGQLSQYRYVHFATHGLADSERPELSTIVLSLYDEQGRAQDGFLRAHEVYNLVLPAELVTLSACETGLGRLTKGEGLVSLTRGFMYAGAARVVVSLWSVNDRATAELMEKFYRRMLVGGERPAAALRAAQVEMRRDRQWEAPYYWAAFTLQGEWR